jgi:hypothetical protein
MRELGMLGFGQGIDESYEDIAAIAKDCRFADCTHTAEKECAVLAGIAAGKLTAERLQSYLKLTKESKYFEMTYLEKRKKDKAFGKMVKNYMNAKQKLQVRDLNLPRALLPCCRRSLYCSAGEVALSILSRPKMVSSDARGIRWGASLQWTEKA